MNVLSGLLTTELSLGSDGQALPAEFRIFAPGINRTQKGDFLYDARAAQLIMRHYELSSARLMIDLEHDSIRPERRAARSDAGDARGWMSLEQRPDGSLWACNVTWTPDGARRLRERTQAYYSPAFAHEQDGEIKRPAHLVNGALCAVPAMYDAPTLVAASAIDLRDVKERARAYVSVRKALSKVGKMTNGSR